jgi:hypothetical protein
MTTEKRYIPMSSATSRLLITILCLAIIGLFAANAEAQRYDRGTRITINQPFEVPGTALPAGTYVMRLMDTSSTQTVVQILNADETKAYAMVIGVRDYRLKAPEDTVITFYEAEPGTPVPIRAWFYPDNNSGVEFVYPKRRALEIARESGEHVIATPYYWEPEYIPEPFENEPLVVVEPTGEEAELAAVHPESDFLEEEPAPAEPVLAAEAVAPPELPRTATPLPLVALTGLLAAATAGALRMLRMRKG